MKNSKMPGTISETLWHFTGGPKTGDNGKGSEEPKPNKDAYDIVVKILNSKKLMVSYKPEVEEYPSGTDGIDFAEEMQKVCCMAEIPLKYLPYHAKRYGKFAIGFKREDALDAGFRPVLYCLDNEDITRDFFLIRNFIKNQRDKPEGLLEKCQYILAHIKTFKEDEFNTIYCEREWRSLKTYCFAPKNLSEIVIPNEYSDRLKKDCPIINVIAYRGRNPG